MTDWTCCQPSGQCTQAPGCPAGGACHSQPGCKDLHCPGHPGAHHYRRGPVHGLSSRADWDEHTALCWLAAVAVLLIWMAIGAWLDQPKVAKIPHPQCAGQPSTDWQEACRRLAEYQTARATP